MAQRGKRVSRTPASPQTYQSAQQTTTNTTTNTTVTNTTNNILNSSTIKRRKCRQLKNESSSQENQQMIVETKLPAIYNRGSNESAPAELFRKDLISAMKLPDNEPLAPNEYWLITDQWKQEWERGVQVPVNPDSLPEANVRGRGLGRCGLEFKLPKKFVRISRDEHFNPDEHHLSTTPTRAEKACAYDLDDMDVAWLELLNGERAQMGQTAVTESQLERVIEELEMRCWERIQTIVKNEEGLGIEYDENVICDVCRSPDSEEGNEMVFCDCCNICVHQACYGITQIPDGSWLCRTCSLSQRPDCVLCPNKGGAMKCTRSGQKWAHVSCALWIPEVSIGCVERMEPITKISSIPQSRWALICVLCRERVGACIQCSIKTCKTAYHVTCAFKYGLEMKAIIEDEMADDGVKLRSYCQKHSRNTKDKTNGPTKNGSDTEDDTKRRKRKDMTSEEKNQARAAKLQEIEAEFDKHVALKDIIGCQQLDVDQEALIYIHNYWKLKRRASHNKPLLAPRHPDLSPALSRSQCEAAADLEKMRTFVQLRQDLERVRNLCYMVGRREKLCRSFLRLREQTFHKQVLLLSTSTNFTASTYSAILNSNHTSTLYDRLYSHESENVENIDIAGLIRCLNGEREEEEEEEECEFNGSNKLLWCNGKKILSDLSESDESCRNSAGKRGKRRENDCKRSKADKKRGSESEEGTANTNLCLSSKTSSNNTNNGNVLLKSMGFSGRGTENSNLEGKNASNIGISGKTGTGTGIGPLNVSGMGKSTGISGKCRGNTDTISEPANINTECNAESTNNTKSRKKSRKIELPSTSDNEQSTNTNCAVKSKKFDKTTRNRTPKHEISTDSDENRLKSKKMEKTESERKPNLEMSSDSEEVIPKSKKFDSLARKGAIKHEISTDSDENPSRTSLNTKSRSIAEKYENVSAISKRKKPEIMDSESSTDNSTLNTTKLRKIGTDTSSDSDHEKSRTSTYNIKNICFNMKESKEKCKKIERMETDSENASSSDKTDIGKRTGNTDTGYTSVSIKRAGTSNINTEIRVRASDGINNTNCNIETYSIEGTKFLTNTNTDAIKDEPKSNIDLTHPEHFVKSEAYPTSTVNTKKSRKKTKSKPENEGHNEDSPKNTETPKESLKKSKNRPDLKSESSNEETTSKKSRKNRQKSKIDTDSSHSSENPKNSLKKSRPCKQKLKEIDSREIESNSLRKTEKIDIKSRQQKSRLGLMEIDSSDTETNLKQRRDMSVSSEEDPVAHEGTISVRGRERKRASDSKKFGNSSGSSMDRDMDSLERVDSSGSGRKRVGCDTDGLERVRTSGERVNTDRAFVERVGSSGEHVGNNGNGRKRNSGGNSGERASSSGERVGSSGERAGSSGGARKHIGSDTDVFDRLGSNNSEQQRVNTDRACMNSGERMLISEARLDNTTMVKDRLNKSCSSSYESNSDRDSSDDELLTSAKKFNVERRSKKSEKMDVEYFSDSDETVNKKSSVNVIDSIRKTKKAQRKMDVSSDEEEVETRSKLLRRRNLSSKNKKMSRNKKSSKNSGKSENAILESENIESDSKNTRLSERTTKNDFENLEKEERRGSERKMLKSSRSSMGGGTRSKNNSLHSMEREMGSLSNTDSDELITITSHGKNVGKSLSAAIYSDTDSDNEVQTPSSTLITKAAVKEFLGNTGVTRNWEGKNHKSWESSTKDLKDCNSNKFTEDNEKSEMNSTENNSKTLHIEKSSDNSSISKVFDKISRSSSKLNRNSNVSSSNSSDSSSDTENSTRNVENLSDNPPKSTIDSSKADIIKHSEIAKNIIENNRKSAVENSPKTAVDNTNTLKSSENIPKNLSGSNIKSISENTSKSTVKSVSKNVTTSITSVNSSKSSSNSSLENPVKSTNSDIAIETSSKNSEKVLDSSNIPETTEKPSRSSSNVEKSPKTVEKSKNSKEGRKKREILSRDLIVPQRQAAKKASENLQRSQQRTTQEETKEKPLSEEKRRKKRNLDIFDFEKDSSSKEETLSYVPQRQAAKKAAETIKSGLGKEVNSKLNCNANTSTLSTKNLTSSINMNITATSSKACNNSNTPISTNASSTKSLSDSNISIDSTQRSEKLLLDVSHSNRSTNSSIVSRESNNSPSPSKLSRERSIDTHADIIADNSDLNINGEKLLNEEISSSNTPSKDLISRNGNASSKSPRSSKINAKDSNSSNISTSSKSNSGTTNANIKADVRGKYSSTENHEISTSSSSSSSRSSCSSDSSSDSENNDSSSDSSSSSNYSRVNATFDRKEVEKYEKLRENKLEVQNYEEKLQRTRIYDDKVERGGIFDEKIEKDCVLDSKMEESGNTNEQGSKNESKLVKDDSRSDADQSSKGKSVKSDFKEVRSVKTDLKDVTSAESDGNKEVRSAKGDFKEVSSVKSDLKDIKLSKTDSKSIIKSSEMISSGVESKESKSSKGDFKDVRPPKLDSKELKSTKMDAKDLKSSKILSKPTKKRSQRSRTSETNLKTAEATSSSSYSDSDTAELHKNALKQSQNTIMENVQIEKPVAETRLRKKLSSSSARVNEKCKNSDSENSDENLYARLESKRQSTLEEELKQRRITRELKKSKIFDKLLEKRENLDKIRLRNLDAQDVTESTLKNTLLTERNLKKDDKTDSNRRNVDLSTRNRENIDSNLSKLEKSNLTQANIDIPRESDGKNDRNTRKDQESNQNQRNFEVSQENLSKSRNRERSDDPQAVYRDFDDLSMRNSSLTLRNIESLDCHTKPTEFHGKNLESTNFNVKQVESPMRHRETPLKQGSNIEKTVETSEKSKLDSRGKLDLKEKPRDEKELEDHSKQRRRINPRSIFSPQHREAVSEFFDFDLNDEISNENFPIREEERTNPLNFTFNNELWFKEDSKEDSARETLNLVEKLRLELSKKSNSIELPPETRKCDVSDNKTEISKGDSFRGENDRKDEDSINNANLMSGTLINCRTGNNSRTTLAQTALCTSIPTIDSKSGISIDNNTVSTGYAVTGVGNLSSVHCTAGNSSISTIDNKNDVSASSKVGNLSAGHCTADNTSIPTIDSKNEVSNGNTIVPTGYAVSAVGNLSAVHCTAGNTSILANTTLNISGITNANALIVNTTAAPGNTSISLSNINTNPNSELIPNSLNIPESSALPTNSNICHVPSLPLMPSTNMCNISNINPNMSENLENSNGNNVSISNVASDLLPTSVSGAPNSRMGANLRSSLLNVRADMLTTSVGSDLLQANVGCTIGSVGNSMGSDLLPTNVGCTVGTMGTTLGSSLQNVGSDLLPANVGPTLGNVTSNLNNVASDLGSSLGSVVTDFLPTTVGSVISPINNNVGNIGSKIGTDLQSASIGCTAGTLSSNLNNAVSDLGSNLGSVGPDFLPTNIVSAIGSIGSTISSASNVGCELGSSLHPTSIGSATVTVSNVGCDLGSTNVSTSTSNVPRDQESTDVPTISNVPRDLGSNLHPNAPTSTNNVPRELVPSMHPTNVTTTTSNVPRDLGSNFHPNVPNTVTTMGRLNAHEISSKLDKDKYTDTHMLLYPENLESKVSIVERSKLDRAESDERWVPPSQFDMDRYQYEVDESRYVLPMIRQSQSRGKHLESAQDDTNRHLIDEQSEDLQEYRESCSPYELSSLKQDRWSESQVLPSRRSTSSSITSASSEETATPYKSNLNMPISNIPYQNIENYYGENFTGPVSLFPSQNLNFPPMFPPPFGAPFPSTNLLHSNLINKQIEDVSVNISPCTATFTSTSHNMALTAAIISPKLETEEKTENSMEIESPRQSDEAESIEKSPQASKKSSKPLRVSLRVSNHKSPGKSPRSECSSRSTSTNRGRGRGKSSRGRGRGRGRGRPRNPVNSDEITVNKFSGTVYDFDSDEESNTEVQITDLRTMRERKKSSEIEKSLDEQKLLTTNVSRKNSPEFQSNSVKSISISISIGKGNSSKNQGNLSNSTSFSKNSSNLTISGKNPGISGSSNKSLGNSGNVVTFTKNSTNSSISSKSLAMENSGGILARNVGNMIGSSKTAGNHTRKEGNSSLGNFGNSTLAAEEVFVGNEVLPVIPGPVDMRTYSSTEIVPTSESYASNFGTSTEQNLQDLEEDLEKELSLKNEDKVKEEEKVGLCDSRNQLKVKIKGPFLDANYGGNSVPPLAQQAPVIITPNASSASGASGTSNLRRMRKKELLRQYCSQDMNMDPNAGLPTSTPTLPPINRTVITIPKAVASMTSIPTREDYKAVVDANTEKKRQSNSSERRRGRPRPSAATSAPPKLKIKIGNSNLNEQVIPPSDTKIRPPKKRLTSIPTATPTMEELRRESMKFRRMIMAGFESDDKLKLKGKKSRNNKRKRRQERKEARVRLLEDDGASTPKLIITLKPSDTTGNATKNSGNSNSKINYSCKLAESENYCEKTNFPAENPSFDGKKYENLCESVEDMNYQRKTSNFNENNSNTYENMNFSTLVRESSTFSMEKCERIESTSFTSKQLNFREKDSDISKKQGSNFEVINASTRETSNLRVKTSETSDTNPNNSVLSSIDTSKCENLDFRPKHVDSREISDEKYDGLNIKSKDAAGSTKINAYSCEKSAFIMKDCDFPNENSNIRNKVHNSYEHLESSSSSSDPKIAESCDNFPNLSEKTLNYTEMPNPDRDCTKVSIGNRSIHENPSRNTNFAKSLNFGRDKETSPEKGPLCTNTRATHNVDVRLNTNVIDEQSNIAIGSGSVVRSSDNSDAEHSSCVTITQSAAGRCLGSTRCGSGGSATNSAATGSGALNSTSNSTATGGGASSSAAAGSGAAGSGATTNSAIASTDARDRGASQPTEKKQAEVSVKRSVRSAKLTPIRLKLTRCQVGEGYELERKVEREKEEEEVR